MAAPSPLRKASTRRMWVLTGSTVKTVIGLAHPGGRQAEGLGDVGLEQEADEEDRRGVAEDAEQPDHHVGDRVAVAAGEQAERDADEQRDQERRQGQAQRRAAVVADHRAAPAGCR